MFCGLGKKFFWVSFFYFSFFAFIFLYFPTEIKAQQQCGSATTQIIKTCSDASGECKTSELFPSSPYTCYNNSGTCSGSVVNRICGYQDNICQVINGSPLIITIPCGGTPPPGGGGGGGGGCSAGEHRETFCSKSCASGTQCGIATDGTIKRSCSRCVADACTAPTITSVTRVSPTSLKVNWTRGTGTTSQSVYVGSNKNQVNNNCPAGSSCVVKARGLAATLTTYTTGNVLAAGTVYYVRVVNAGTCNKGDTSGGYLSSCSVSPATSTMGVNSTLVPDLQTVINTDSSNAITQVTYSSSDTNIATVTTPDTTKPSYTTTVTSGPTAGSTTVTSNVYFGATLACTAAGGVTVIANQPWWQTKDADIVTNGDLISQVPGGGFFDLAGSGNYAGVPVFGGSTNLSTANVSTNSWLVNSLSQNTRIYDYKFFANQVPSDVTFADSATLTTPITPQYGYEWYKYDGSSTGLDLSLDSSLDIGSRKVILLVNSADFKINAPINLTKGQGFFMVVVGKNSDGTGKGNIIVDPTVGGGGAPNLEGIYLADGLFKTGAGDTQLWIRGSVASYGGVTFERDLGGAGNASPAELFEFAPDQMLLFPSKLSARRINWKEVAP